MSMSTAEWLAIHIVNDEEIYNHFQNLEVGFRGMASQVDADREMHDALLAWAEDVDGVRVATLAHTMVSGLISDCNMKELREIVGVPGE